MPISEVVVIVHLLFVALLNVRRYRRSRWCSNAQLK
jgi:hypothetical protein